MWEEAFGALRKCCECVCAFGHEDLGGGTVGLGGLARVAEVARMTAAFVRKTERNFRRTIDFHCPRQVTAAPPSSIAHPAFGHTREPNTQYHTHTSILLARTQRARTLANPGLLRPVYGNIQHRDCGLLGTAYGEVASKAKCVDEGPGSRPGRSL